MEKGLAGAHHALALALERRIPGLAHGMLGHVDPLSGRTLRHPRRRHGPDVPPPRMRDRAVDGGPGPRFGTLLGAQQHDHDQRTEDGQVAGQLHHAGGALHRQPPAAGAGLHPHDDPLFRTAGPLPLDARLLERSAPGRRKGARPPDERHRGARQDQACGGIDGRPVGTGKPLPRGDGRRSELADGHLGPLRLGAHDQPAGRRGADHHGSRSGEADGDRTPLCVRHPGAERRKSRRNGLGTRLRDPAGRNAAGRTPAGPRRQGLGGLRPHPRRTGRGRHPGQGPQGRQRLGTGIK